MHNIWFTVTNSLHIRIQTCSSENADAEFRAEQCKAKESTFEGYIDLVPEEGKPRNPNIAIVCIII